MTPPPPRTALITGAAKRIGAAMAKTLAEEHYAVAIHYHHSRDDAEALRDEIAANGGRAEIFAADLTDRKQIAGLIPQILQTLPPIAVLINNASVFQWEQWHSVDTESWDKHIMTNLEAPFWLSQAMAEQLPQDARGVIINMVDQRVKKITPYFTSYTIAKSGLWAMTKSLALALAPNIRVNAIGPGPTLPSSLQTPEQFKRQWQNLPLEQATPVEEICEAVNFLIRQTSITGQMIALDGGEHLGWAQEKLKD